MNPDKPAKPKKKDPAAVAFGRQGGQRSRVNFTPEQRAKLAKTLRARRPGRKTPRTGARQRRRRKGSECPQTLPWVGLAFGLALPTASLLRKCPASLVG